MILKFTEFDDIYDGTIELKTLKDSDGYTTYRYAYKPSEQLFFTKDGDSDISFEVKSLIQGKLYDKLDSLLIIDVEGKNHYFDNPIKGYFTLITPEYD